MFINLLTLSINVKLHVIIMYVYRAWDCVERVKFTKYWIYLTSFK